MLNIFYVRAVICLPTAALLPSPNYRAVRGVPPPHRGPERRVVLRVLAASNARRVVLRVPLDWVLTPGSRLYRQKFYHPKSLSNLTRCCAVTVDWTICIGPSEKSLGCHWYSVLRSEAWKLNQSQSKGSYDRCESVLIISGNQNVLCLEQVPTCSLHLMSTCAQDYPIRVSWVEDESAQRLIWPSWISSHHFRVSECALPGASANMRPSSNVNMRTEVSRQSELSWGWISAKAHKTVVNQFSWIQGISIIFAWSKCLHGAFI